MNSVSQLESLFHLLQDNEVEKIARETGFIVRQREVTGANFVQTLVFACMEQPETRIEDFRQVARSADLTISAVGLSHRFTPQAAAFLYQVLQRVAQQVMTAAPVEVPLLRRFEAVIVEESSVVRFPDEVEEVWQGCGGSEEGVRSSVKLHTRWDVLTGRLYGPCLQDGRLSDNNSPWKQDPLPARSLYLAAECYYDLHWLQEQAKARRKWLVRLKGHTVLTTPTGKRIDLRRVLPQRVGEGKQMRVRVGAKVQQPARLLMVRVPAEVAEQRREQLRDDARRRGQSLSPQQLDLAEWTILITNASAKCISLAEALVLMRLRWQIELLFKLWKEQGKIDEWRSQRPWRILCEFYAKMIAMILQHWLLLIGTWHDPHRSLVKASAVVRRMASHLLGALKGRERFEQVIATMSEQMEGCRLNPRQTHPNCSQLLLAGLDWTLS